MILDIEVQNNYVIDICYIILETDIERRVGVLWLVLSLKRKDSSRVDWKSNRKFERIGWIDLKLWITEQVYLA